MPPEENGQEPTNQNQPVVTGQEPTNNDKTPTSQEQPKDGASNVQDLPEWARGLITELRNENAKHRNAKTAAEKAAQDAEEKKLEQQAEWQKLADTRQARIAELEPLGPQIEALAERITTTMNAEIKDWPEEVKALAPTEPVSPAAMLDWLDKHRPLAAKLTEQAQAKPTGNRPGPQNGRLAQPNQEQRRDERARVHRAF